MQFTLSQFDSNYGTVSSNMRDIGKVFSLIL